MIHHHLPPPETPYREILRGGTGDEWGDLWHLASPLVAPTWFNLLGGLEVIPWAP